MTTEWIFNELIMDVFLHQYRSRLRYSFKIPSYASPNASVMYICVIEMVLGLYREVLVKNSVPRRRSSGYVYHSLFVSFYRFYCSVKLGTRRSETLCTVIARENVLEKTSRGNAEVRKPAM